MNITFIISTLNDGIFKIPEENFYKLKNVIIVHQVTDGNDYSYFVNKYNEKKSNIKYLVMNEKGLSKSRNKGLDNCSTEWAYILDDDVLVYDDILDKLETETNSENSVFTFYHSDVDETVYKKYKKKRFNHNVISLAKVASIDLFLNVSLINKKNIRFDENFGLGTKYPSGEEYILLTDCLDKKIKVINIPVFTTKHPNEASGNDFFSSVEKISSKKMMFNRLRTPFSKILKIMFLIKKIYPLVKNKSLLKFMKHYL
ncbi:glycosyltransferase [Photobacterium leiognathi]|uniref:glycosyltransferase n=1 Tax=Photobacterium leiognathi TaxID=553611 RepID=UPI002981AE66|nr:glycosyltransferase [Photobacterium leiognathi]